MIPEMTLYKRLAYDQPKRGPGNGFQGDRNTHQQAVTAFTSFALARRINLLLTLETLVACGPRAGFVVTLVNLRIGVTKLNGNVTLELVLETDGLHL